MKRRALLALALGLLVSCSKAKTEAPPAETEVTVYAASSLREAFAAIATDFEKQHAGVHVQVQLAGSQQLRTQIEQGAKADVFASADERHMEALASKGLAVAPAVFAIGEPVLVVGGDALEVQRFSDLPRAKRVVLGADEVPIGRYADAILDKSAAGLGESFKRDVLARVVSREPNVRQVLAKLRLGEADAAIVYRTDAIANPEGVRVVTIPAAYNVVARYPIARLASAEHPTLAQAWVDAVRSAEGQERLRAAGFLSPER